MTLTKVTNTFHIIFLKYENHFLWDPLFLSPSNNPNKGKITFLGNFILGAPNRDSKKNYFEIIINKSF